MLYLNSKVTAKILDISPKLSDIALAKSNL
jgi:hypothetical protein